MNGDWKYRTMKRSKSGNRPLSKSTLYHAFRNVRYASLVPDLYDKDRFSPSEYPAMIT